MGQRMRCGPVFAAAVGRAFIVVREYMYMYTHTHKHTHNTHTQHTHNTHTTHTQHTHNTHTHTHTHARTHARARTHTHELQAVEPKAQLFAISVGEQACPLCDDLICRLV